VGRTLEKLQTVESVHGKNIAGKIIPLQGDVTKKSDVDKLVKEIESKHGFLDILVNDAGIAPGKTEPSGKTAAELKKNLYDDVTDEDWSATYMTNVYGPYLMSVAFIPLLQAATERTKG
jgi:NAD(P)-dependent dehydrogenase (short-subunit alcohol dehydrogenase family)